MTYEVKRPGAQKDDQVGKSAGNPYDQVAQGGDGGGLSTSTFSSAIKPKSGMPLSGQTAPTATGYVNFDRLYNANAGVSQREAQQRQASAAQGAASARAGAQGLQNQFGTAVRTGSIQGPTAAQQDWAQYGGANGIDPKRVARATAVNGHPVVSYADEGLDSGGVTRDSAPVSGDRDMWDHSQDADLEQQVRAGAAGGYTGPDALSGLDEYSKVLQDSTAAQDRVNNPTAGLGNLDAALIGGAGRPGFEQQKRDSGDLTGELARANAASIDQANAARNSSGPAANAYEQLLNDYDARQAQYASNNNSNHDAQTVSNAETLAQRQREHMEEGYDKFGVGHEDVNSLDTPAGWSQLYRDFGLNPDGDTGRLGGGDPANPDDIRNGEADLVKALGITDADIAELKNMDPEQRKAWFEKRKKDKGL